MTVLCRAELIKRIMIGEKLISPERKKAIEACLEAIRSTENKKQMKLAIGHVERYFRQLRSSKEDLQNRRRKIEKYAEYFRKELLEKRPEEITEKLRIEKLPILIDDIDFEECLRQADYDLRLGEDVYRTTERLPEKLTQMGADGTIAIEPGEFGILMTHEYIYMPPDLMGFISIRLTYKQKGLVNISGFHVDPGFYGKLMFAVYNAGPNDVVLRYKERVFMIMFNKLSSPLPKVIESNWNGMENIPVEVVSGLRGTSTSVRNLDERVKKLEMILPILITILVGLIGILLTWVLTRGGGT